MKLDLDALAILAIRVYASAVAEGGPLRGDAIRAVRNLWKVSDANTRGWMAEQICTALGVQRGLLHQAGYRYWIAGRESLRLHRQSKKGSHA